MLETKHKRSSTHEENTKGFTVIEIMFFILVAILIAGAIFYVGKRVGEKDNKSETQSSQSSTKKPAADDPTKNWKTFTDNRAKISFKYPDDWKLDINKVTDPGYEDDGKGDFLEGSITSPTGKVRIDYANFVDGIGGVGCPEAIPCPTVDILALDTIPGLGNVKYIEKITHWKDPEFYDASYGLMSTTDYNSDLKVGKIEDNDPYLLATFGQDQGYFALDWAPNSDQNEGDKNIFSTEAAAKAYLDSDEAKIGKQIVRSLAKL